MRVWVRIIGSPSSGTVAEGATVSAGDTVQVEEVTARRLIAMGWAILSEGPVPVAEVTVATARARVR